MTSTSGELSLHPALYSAGPASAPMLVCLHGVGRSSEDYLSLVNEFSSNWQVITMDFRGHGNSPRALNGYYVANYASDLVALIQNQFSGPVTLYGHSLGAMAALAAAAKLPARINAVILEDPPFHTMGERISETPWLSLFKGMQQVALLEGTISDKAIALGEITFPSCTSNGIRKLREVRSPASLEFSAKCLSKVDPAVFDPIIQGRWLENFDQYQLYKQVRCPALLLQADPGAGGALTEEDAARAEQDIATCKRIRFPMTGHLIRSEKAHEVFQAVKEFLAVVTPPTSLPQNHFVRPLAPVTSNGTKIPTT